MNFRRWVESLGNDLDYLVEGIAQTWPNGLDRLLILADYLEERGEAFAEQVRTVGNYLSTGDCHNIQINMADGNKHFNELIEKFTGYSKPKFPMSTMKPFGVESANIVDNHRGGELHINVYANFVDVERKGKDKVNPHQGEQNLEYAGTVSLNRTREGNVTGAFDMTVRNWWLLPSGRSGDNKIVEERKKVPSSFKAICLLWFVNVAAYAIIIHCRRLKYRPGERYPRHLLAFDGQNWTPANSPEEIDANQKYIAYADYSLWYATTVHDVRPESVYVRFRDIENSLPRYVMNLYDSHRSSRFRGWVQVYSNLTHRRAADRVMKERGVKNWQPPQGEKALKLLGV